MGKVVKRAKSFFKDPKRAITAVATGGLSETVGAAKDVVEDATGRLPTAKPGTGEFAAQAIRSQPFNITAQTEKSKSDASSQQSLAEARAQEVGSQSSELRSALASQARGEGPSLAEAQMRQAQDRSLAQQLAAAASQRGGSPAALQRQLAKQQASAGQEIAQQAGIARMQEQQAAQGLLGQLTAQEQASADQAVNNYLRLGLDIETARAAAAQDLERLRTQARTGAMQAQTQASMANQQSQSQLLGGFLGAGATLLASDKDLKKNLKNDRNSTSDFLNALQAKSYKYKDEKHGKGQQYGITAQDLEKSKMGKSLVLDTPDGKMVDTRRGFGAVLASMAELNKRTATLEKAFKKKKLKSRKEA